MTGNRAEDLFEGYLASNGWRWKYEWRVGPKRPDYVVKTPVGLVVFDVTELKPRSFTEDDASGAFDVFKPLHDKMREKAAQGRAVDGRRPFVIVVHAPNWPTDPMAVSGALLGRPELQIPINEPFDTAQVTTLGGDSKFFQRGRRNYVSAVSILHTFNPTIYEFERELEHAAPTIAEAVAVAQRLTTEGRIDEAAIAPRLVTHHNPWASRPLAHELLAGEFDEQHSEFDGRHKLTSQGIGLGRRSRAA